MSCVVHLNGWPGSGKRTIGHILASQIGARLLDNHVMLNPAEALFERENPLHAKLLNATRLLVLDYAAKLAPDMSLVLTDPLGDNETDIALFEEFRDLAAKRNARLISVLLEITPEENSRRLQTPAQAEHRKLTRPDLLSNMRENNELLRPSGVESVALDVTQLSPEMAATRISEWLKRPQKAGTELTS